MRRLSLASGTAAFLSASTLLAAGSGESRVEFGLIVELVQIKPERRTFRLEGGYEITLYPDKTISVDYRQNTGKGETLRTTKWSGPLKGPDAQTGLNLVDENTNG